MKYVRTKDGIYELDKYKEKYHYFKVNGSAYKLQKISECKQANTIEELGDVYVIAPKDSKSKPYTVNTLSMFDDVEDVLRHNDIYLSIWVGALLKHAAKMNDKGDLELL